MEGEPKIEYGTIESNESKVESAPASEPERSVEQESGEEGGQYPSRTMRKKIAREMVFAAKKEFPEDIQRIIENMQKGKEISRGAQSRFDRATNTWWRERFGASFFSRNLSASIMEDFKTRSEESRRERQGGEELGKPRKEQKEEERRKQMSNLQKQKYKKMTELHSALTQLDKGETIKKFQDSTRKFLFYDGQTGAYYITGESGQRYLGIGDILSDYAWKIQYVPDRNMPQHIFRQVAKQILINEARRDIEIIYDKELSETRDGATLQPSISYLEKKWGNPQSRNVWRGIIAERMCREWLSRVSLNQEFGFAVMRANGLEDGLYKIDFKLRTSRKTRGIIAGDQDSCEEFLGKIRKIGIQFTIRKRLGGKSVVIEQAKKIFGGDIPVDDIVLVRIFTSEFDDAFDKWLMAGKPSGGPEQFLSKDLKARLLREATRRLVKIEDEKIEELIR